MKEDNLEIVLTAEEIEELMRDLPRLLQIPDCNACKEERNTANFIE